MASHYMIQVIEKNTGHVAHQWEPGRASEVEFCENLVNRVAAKGVGIGRTQRHVIEDVRSALQELLYDLKLTV